MQTEPTSARDLAPAPADVCSTCGGDGYLESDGFTPRRGHYSISEPCPTCADAIGDDYEPGELTDAQAARAEDARGHREAVIL